MTDLDIQSQFKGDEVKSPNSRRVFLMTKMLYLHLSFLPIILVLQYDTIQAFSIPCFDPFSGESTQFNPATELCCSGWVYVKENNNSQCCNSFVFNSQTEVCCNGQVTAQTGGLTECCDTVAFDPASATCCFFNGISTVHAGKGPCCGSQGLYRPSEEVCCSSYTDNVFKVHAPSSYSERCCGSELYDTHLETCCNKKILHGVGSCCGSSAFDESKEICCGGTIHPKSSNETACCGNLVFNQRTSTCCSGRVHDITDGECCRDEVFQPSTSSCCRGVISNNIPQVPGIQHCCGAQSYLSTEQICCSGYLFPKEEHSECCGNAAYDTTTQLCCGEWYSLTIVEKKSSSTTCCGQVTYEPETETCCERTNQVFPSPGGRCCIMEDGQEEMYDPRFGVCCSHLFSETFYEGISSFDNSSVCCGAYLLEEHQLCDWINMVPVVKSSPSDDMVCSGVTADDSETYNSLSMVCSYGTLIPLKSTETVCGNEVMDESTEICCSGIFVHAKYDNNEERVCCEGSLFPYTPSKQMCCSSMIYDIPEDEGRCCGYKGYSILTEVCDDNYMVRPVGKPHLCGYQFYSKDEHFCCGEQELIGPGYTCCGGVSFNTGTPNINDGGCCEGVGYNPDTHVCCGSKIHGRTSRDLDCCGDGTFSAHQKEDHICCDGVLQQTHHGRNQCQGTMAFNPDRETVCDGVRYPVQHGTCCGSSLMDEETEICCEGTAFPKDSSTSLACCGSTVYDPEDPSTVCCQNVLHRNSDGAACCGTHVYNPRSRQCCSDDGLFYLYAKQEHHHCCGALLYNSTKHQCCDGNLYKFHANVPCCGEDISTRVDTLCCEGHPVEKVFGASSKCCGTNVYDQTIHECLASDFGDVIVEKQGNIGETSVQCIESAVNMTSDNLAETFANFSSIIIISRPTMKKRSNRDVCKTRITMVLKYPPGTTSQWLSNGRTLHLGQRCPCAGIQRSSVLFTNHLISCRNFEPSDGDVIMASSKKIKSALKALKSV